MILKEQSSELLLRLQNEYLARGVETNMTKKVPKKLYRYSGVTPYCWKI